MDNKTKAIISHVWVIGWVIALIMNQNDEKNEYTSFYLRQTIGLYLAFLLNFIPKIGWIISIAIFILWGFSFWGALKGEKKEIPLVGAFFQQLFHFL